MPFAFDEAIVAAVLHHMNDDHRDDSLLIARAFAQEGDAVTDAVMVGLDGDAGIWSISRGGESEQLRVPWPGGSISERPEVRREVVALYDLACERLGVAPRPHA